MSEPNGERTGKGPLPAGLDPYETDNSAEQTEADFIRSALESIGDKIKTLLEKPDGENRDMGMSYREKKLGNSEIYIALNQHTGNDDSKPAEYIVSVRQIRGLDLLTSQYSWPAEAPGDRQGQRAQTVDPASQQPRKERYSYRREDVEQIQKLIAKFD